MRVALVYNPEAGQALLPQALAPLAPRHTDPPWLADTVAYLKARCESVDVVAAATWARVTGASREAAQAGVDVLIAAGGDGTLRAAADGLAGTETALGILPRGTVNVLAREVGIPLTDHRTAVDICLQDATRRIDLGRIDGRHFLLMCSAGFDAATVENVNLDVKGVVGVPAYVLSAIATLAAYTPSRFRLELDGERRDVEAFMLTISNASSYGGDFKIAPHASLEDGVLDVCLFEAPPGAHAVQRAAFLRQMGAMALGRHLLDPDVHYFRARRVQVDAEPAVATQIDGDALGATPLLVEIAPRALSVRVPST